MSWNTKSTDEESRFDRAAFHRRIWSLLRWLRGRPDSAHNHERCTKGHYQGFIDEHPEALELIARNVPGVLFQYRLRPDGSSHFPYASEGTQQIFGISPESVRHDASLAFSLVHPEDLPRVLERVAKSAATLEDWRCEFRVCLADGRLVWVEGHSTPRRESDGGIRWFGQLTDTTDRKLAGEAVRDSEEQYRILFEASHDAIMTIDPPSLRFTAGNRTALKLFGARNDQEFLSLDPLQLSPEYQPDGQRSEQKAKEVYQQVLQLGRHSFTWTHKRLDGQEFLAEVTLTRINRKKQVSLLATVRDVTEQRHAEQALRKEAVTDKLTGLPNRTYLRERIDQLIQKARQRRDYGFGVMFLDIDRFKIVNDSLGHAAGDQLLLQFAKRLQTTVLASDPGPHPRKTTSSATAARLGGDEFVVLLEGMQLSQITGIANRVLNCLAEPFVVQDRELFSSASIGIVTNDTAPSCADDVLRDADTAMYEAKSRGKGRFVVFDHSMRARVHQRLVMENDLRRGIASGQMYLVYQPIVSLDTNRLQSFEALLRWNHPQRGLISPSAFIPVAEDCGLIVSIGQWVMREVCQMYARWCAELGDDAPATVSINLSREQLLLPDLPERVCRILTETGVSAQRVHLEVTESAVMCDQHAAVQMLARLKQLGVKIDLDDFGTGYSSLACLHQFPLDIVKIDRSFVHNLGRGSEFDALVRAVIQLAQNLGMAVVAEGIETMEQRQTLLNLGCEFGQGHLFAKPLPADEAIQFGPPIDSPLPFPATRQMELPLPMCTG